MDFNTDKIALIKMLRSLYPKIREIVLDQEANQPDDGWAPIMSLGLREAKDLVEGYARDQLVQYDPKLQELRRLEQQIQELAGSLDHNQREAWNRIRS